MAGTLGLAAWCAGISLGYLGYGPVPATFAVAAAAVVVACAGMQWLSETRPGATAQRRSRLRVSVLLLALALGAVGLARGSTGRPPQGPGSVRAYEGQTVTISGGVDSAGAPSAGLGANPAARLQTLHVNADTIDTGGHQARVDGAVLVQARGQAELFDGERVRIHGKLVPLRRLGPAGTAGYADRLERAGVLAEMPAATVQALDPPSPVSPARAAAGVRQGLIVAVRANLPEPEATVVLGEVAGIRSSLPAETDADLVDSGLVHILAISGIKVAIVAALLRAVVVPVFGRRGALLSIAGVAFYTIVGGATASALRSALMGSLGLLGGLIRRDTDVMRSLMLAAGSMLCLRPSLVTDVSFQYSFLGVLGIHAFARRFEGRLDRIPRPFREALAVTLAAQLATIPLTAHYFHVVPLLGPVTNAIVLPMLPAGIVGGMTLALLHTIATATGGLPGQVARSGLVPVGALVFALARAALLVAHVARSLPAAALHMATFDIPASVAYYGAGTLVAVAPVMRWPRIRIYALAVAVVLMTLVALGRPDGHLHVDFVAGVTGPVAVLVAPDGATMLVGSGSSASALGPALDAQLPASAPLPGTPRRLDAVALTGSTREETGGLGALAGRRIDLVLAPSGMTGSAALDAVARLQEQGARSVSLASGDALYWHGTELIPHAGGGPGEIALEIHWHSIRVLLVSSSDARNPPMLPPGAFQVVAVGSGAAAPAMDGVDVGRVVVQSSGAATGGSAASPAHPVARTLTQLPAGELWETAQNGDYNLNCDLTRCGAP